MAVLVNEKNGYFVDGAEDLAEKIINKLADTPDELDSICMRAMIQDLNTSHARIFTKKDCRVVVIWDWRLHKAIMLFFFDADKIISAAPCAALIATSKMLLLSI